MLPVPWWLPALILGAARLLWPTRPAVAVLAYHAVCLLGLRRPFAWGTISQGQIFALAAAFALLPALLLVPPLPFFPKAAVQALVSGWPGGLWNWAAYACLVNVALEEGFWRGALPRRHAWSDWRHGLAFGLHHGVVAAVSLPWLWVLPALLVPAAAGAIWMATVRRSGGLGLALLTHLWADLALVLLVAGQL
jgi:membrane protease YdiL (CAAX protease family)